jgi:hypothetical protein
MVPRKQAGHMTCTRPQAERQNFLAMRASSTHDPNDPVPFRPSGISPAKPGDGELS